MCVCVCITLYCLDFAEGRGFRRGRGGKTTYGQTGNLFGQRGQGERCLLQEGDVYVDNGVIWVT